MQQPKQVGAWPDSPRRSPREAGCCAPGPAHAFPSGRAAILACLRYAGVGPDSVVATPECVTACVADVVRRWARPVPLRAALGPGASGGSRRPGAAIVYEQWGWPLPPPAQEAVCTRLAGVPVVVDRVDSADFFLRPRTYGAFEVVSLSKVLGMDAGGLARAHDGAYLRFVPGTSLRQAPSANHPRLRAHPAVRELFKQSNHVHPAVLRWLQDNCATSALDAEYRARRTALELVRDSQLSEGWPLWMTQAIDSGAGPVWAPVLRGADPTVHAQALAQLERTWSVRAAVRIFNWTGNPLSPTYEPAIALPIHGGVHNLAEIVSRLGLTRSS
jgi:hypothetical protein